MLSGHLDVNPRRPTDGVARLSRPPSDYRSIAVTAYYRQLLRGRPADRPVPSGQSGIWRQLHPLRHTALSEDGRDLSRPDRARLTCRHNTGHRRVLALAINKVALYWSSVTVIGHHCRGPKICVERRSGSFMSPYDFNCFQ
jgi:hypothetical protein